MPSIDESAKAFEMALAARFGLAVKARRQALKLSASEVSRRTAQLGYPLSRGAVAKIESNSRSGKVDVAELWVLAMALDIPPSLLLFDGFPSDQPVEVLPGYQTLMPEAMRWTWGDHPSPRRAVCETIEGDGQDVRWRLTGRPNSPNDGVALIKASGSLKHAIAGRGVLVMELDRARKGDGDVDTAQASLDLHDERIELFRARVAKALTGLWGTRGQDEDLEEDGDD